MVLLGINFSNLENSKLKIIAKAFMPNSFRQFLRSVYRSYIFKKALKQFIRNPRAAIYTSNNTITDLIYGWGNEAWSTSDEYAITCLKHAYNCKKPILECGSGLTTILLGIVAQQVGNEIWSIEHDRQWGNRVNNILSRYNINSVKVFVNPLKDYGDFVWYDPPMTTLPSSFGLVVCDGPPGNIKGNRYGLLPIMKKRMLNDCVILLDDAVRNEEKIIALKWAKELHCKFEMLGAQYPFIRFVVPAKEGSSHAVLLDRVS